MKVTWPVNVASSAKLTN